MAQRYNGITAPRHHCTTASRHHGTTAQRYTRHHGITAPRHHGTTSLRHHGITAPRLTPLRRYAVTPLRHYAITPLRHYAITRLRHCAITPLRLYAIFLISINPSLTGIITFSIFFCLTDHFIEVYNPFCLGIPEVIFNHFTAPEYIVCKNKSSRFNFIYYKSVIITVFPFISINKYKIKHMSSVGIISSALPVI